MARRKKAPAFDPNTCRPAWLFDDSPISDPLGRGERVVQFVKNLTNWRQWVDAGHVLTTPGEVVDYGVIEQQVMDLCARFNVLEGAIDRFNATGTVNRLMDDGVNVLRHGQGMVSMSRSCKEFQRAVLAGEITHGGHPALRWQVGNAVIDTDAAENIKVTKARSRSAPARRR